MLTNAARSSSRLALVACLLLVGIAAIAVTPALAATTATDDSPAVEPTLVTALQLLTNDGVSAGQASALSVTGDATPAHWRTIGWEVDKSADVASQNVPVGGAATFNYTVSVTHDDGTPSWEVSGQLTVENPNSADVTDVVVSNALDDPNATCVVVGDSSTIPANGSAVFGYSCSYSAAPASSSQTSTATISWPAQTLADSSSLAAGSASTSATVVWGDPPSILGGSGDVFDSLVGPLGSISYTDPSPVTFTYPYTFNDAPAGCASYDNTAVVGQEAAEFASDTASVEVCAGGSDLTVTKTASLVVYEDVCLGCREVGRPASSDGRSRCECDLQLPRRCEQGRRCGFRLGGERCDHGQQPERLGCCSRPGRQRPGWELCCSRRRASPFPPTTRSRSATAARSPLAPRAPTRRLPAGTAAPPRPPAAPPRRQPTTPSSSQARSSTTAFRSTTTATCSAPPTTASSSATPRASPAPPAPAPHTTTPPPSTTTKPCSPPPTPSPSRCARVGVI